MDLTITASAPAFLAAAGWGSAAIEPLPGDASNRRYFRLRGDKGTAMLMHAPPPGEDPEPFIRAARWLDSNGMRAPLIHAEDAGQGFVLLEDFGEVRMREYLDAWPQDESEVYRHAVDALLQLHRLPPGPFTQYSLAEYQREAKLFIDWFCPARGLYVDGKSWAEAWDKALGPLLSRQRPGVTVLRDYHAENIMLVGGLEKQGLLDFQDALVGHRAYDLVSLLQDARRDVPVALETALIHHFGIATGADFDAFFAAYAVLGAQRALRILGIFARLCLKGGKAGYLPLLPRVWGQLQRNLTHPALAGLRAICDSLLPEPTPEIIARIGTQCGTHPHR